jgi:cobalt/nickel transport system permease protein
MSESAARWLDRLGYGDSPVHRLDARAKLAAVAAFVVCVASFPKYEVAGLAPFLAFPVALLVAGGVPARPVLRILAAASPFALLVAVWNPLLDRAPRAVVLGVPVSGGVLSFASVVLRFGLCTGAVLVLVATTSVPALLRALGQLGMPRPFVAQVQLLYRYLFLLVDEGRRLSEARALRDPGHASPRLATGKRMLASLLWRTWERGDRIYDCMKARGFDGRLPALAPSRFGAADALFAASVVATCVAARVLPITRWIGAAALGAGTGGPS